MQEIEKNLISSVERAVTEQLKTGWWGVYGRYAVHELMDNEFGGTDFYIAYAREPSEEPVGYVQRYRPLVEYPGLFFTFARLAEQEITRDRWIDWTRRYGVLGSQQSFTTPQLGRWKGGLAETFSAFKEESQAANETLKLYEAASNPEGPDVGYIKQFGESKSITFEDNSRRRPLNAGAFREGALFMVHTRVQRKLQEECFLKLDLTKEGTFGLSGGFHSLLGAMYLQLAFLTKDTLATRYCRAPGCNKILSFDAPQETPEERVERMGVKGKRKPQKRRSDKEFCDKACYMRWKRRNEKQEATLH